MKKYFILSSLLAILVFQNGLVAQTVTQKDSAARKATEGITSAQLKDFLYFIADDAMQGRDTPSAGLDVAANFIAYNLKKWGVKPAGDNGTYFQRMWVTRKIADITAANAELNGQKLVYGEDYFVDTNSGTASAPVVFGGHGWFHKAKGIDGLAGIDVKDKIVVIYNEAQLPKGLTFQDFQGKLGEDFADPPTYAKMKGAAGLIVVANQRTQSNWANARRQRERGGMTIEKLNDNQGSANIPTIYISQKTANALFEGEQSNPLTTPDLKGFALKSGKMAKITASGKTERVPTQNVAGMIEGSDPVLKSEFVSIGAHYDHVGTNPNAPGEDKIWNGADDDGSGTVAIMGMAEALAKSSVKPKRSMLFLWYAGEEKGLLGSEYFVKYPTVPLDKITININIDMIGRSRTADNTDPRDKDLAGENEMYVIGSNMMSSTLGQITESVNKNYLNMTYNFKYDDPKDTNRFFFRSDHFNFAVNGIPAVFFFNGVHRDYHQPGDHPDKIDYVRMEKITRTIFLTMWELGDLKERPKVDKELPAELRQR